jgi:hypothetical protein
MARNNRGFLIISIKNVLGWFFLARYAPIRREMIDIIHIPNRVDITGIDTGFVPITATLAVCK